MKKHLIITSTQDMDKERWLGFRDRGLGASDIGTVLGMNQYKSKLELFYEKISPVARVDIENIAQFMGQYDEPKAADLWQYWEDSEASVIKNFRDRKIIRKCRRINAYVQNPRFPHLFVSLDRIINKGARGEEGALEIKTIAGYEADKWEAGIPPAHMVQVLTQMLVCEFSFGELAVLKDGRRFDVWPFEYNEKICQNIIDATTDFWERVKAGRILNTRIYEAQRNYNQRLAAELQAELELLEPEPDGTEAYENFLKEKFKRSMAEVGLVAGDDADFKRAKELMALKDKIKKLEDKGREHSNWLKRKIGDNRKLDFGNDGFISWTGEPRKFLIKLKSKK